MYIVEKFLRFNSSVSIQCIWMRSYAAVCPVLCNTVCFFLAQTVGAESLRSPLRWLHFFSRFSFCFSPRSRPSRITVFQTPLFLLLLLAYTLIEIPPRASYCFRWYSPNASRDCIMSHQPSCSRSTPLCFCFYTPAPYPAFFFVFSYADHIQPL